jgi:hypothetical protein
MQKCPEPDAETDEVLTQLAESEVNHHAQAA